MSAKIKTTMSDQSGVFYVMLGLMIIFYVAHMVTSALQILGHTPSQIGGDVSLQTFRELLLIAMLVFKAEGKSIIDKVSGDTTVNMPSDPSASSTGVTVTTS